MTTTQRRPDVTRYAEFHQHDGGRVIPTHTRLTYDRDQPYSVAFRFYPPSCTRPGWCPDHDLRAVTWTFARDLLAAGMLDQQGDGDVKVQPCPQIERAGMVEIRLSSPHGTALLTAPGIVLDDFLAATYRVVPAGEEADELDMDAALARLLDSVKVEYACPVCGESCRVETRHDRVLYWHPGASFPCCAWHDLAGGAAA